MKKIKKKTWQSHTKTENSATPAKDQPIEQNLTSPLHTQEAPETANGIKKTPVTVSAVTQSTASGSAFKTESVSKKSELTFQTTKRPSKNSGSGTTPGFTAKEARPISQKTQLMQRQSEVKTSVGAVQETVAKLSQLQSRQRQTQIISQNKSSILPQSLMIPTPAEPTSIQIPIEAKGEIIPVDKFTSVTPFQQQDTFGPFQQKKTQQASLTTYQKPTTLSNQTVTTASTTTPLHQPLTGSRLRNQQATTSSTTASKQPAPEQNQYATTVQTNKYPSKIPARYTNQPATTLPTKKDEPGKQSSLYGSRRGTKATTQSTNHLPNNQK